MATGLENLKIYQLAEKLEIEVYKMTSIFPQDEKYRSIDQLRRSSSSVSNNIAESYNKYSIKEKTHILNDIAKSEAEETKRNIIRSIKKGLVKEKIALLIANKYTELIKAISGYVRFLREQQNKRRQKLTNL